MAEATEADKAAVRDLIHEYFKFAAVPVPWDGVVNDGVANVFANMYRETVKCSRAMALVPLPPLGPTNINWLASQLAGAVFRRAQGKLDIKCARKVINDFRTDFDMARMGVSALRFSRWS